MCEFNDANASKTIVLTVADHAGLNNLLTRAKDWAAKNQWAVGISEIALGASLLTWGVQSGAIDVGSQLIGTAMSPFPGGGSIGAATGAGIGATATAFVGSIGIVGMGSAIAVPALLLVGAGATVFGAFGYTVGDLTEQFLEPSYSDLLAGGSAALIGVALILDGCRRVIQDDAVLKLASKFKDGVIQLVQTHEKILAESLLDLKQIAKAMSSAPDDATDAAGSAASGLTVGAAGTVAGAAIAASTVTVLGSSTLGSAAVALGLVSAPLWPVIAGGSAGLAVGYGLWKTARHFTRKPTEASVDDQLKLLE